MEKTTKKVTLIKVALSLLLLVAVLAGQIVSQLVGSGLLAAGIPADLCNLTAAVCWLGCGCCAISSWASL